MKLTASQLRQNIYQILDQIIENGEEVEINRRGHIIKLVPDTKKSKIERLKNNRFSDEPSENFESIDWSSEWKGAKDDIS